MYVLTALFLLILCVAVSVAVLIVPYEKCKTYLNIVFMDQSMKITPSAGLDGLVIKENEIPTEPIPVSTENPENSGTEQTYYDQGEIVRPSFGEQYAILNCEEIALSVPVYWGSSPELLELGACQASSSVVLGETGNVVIDAHVNTFFADLSEIQPGATVTLFTTYGIFTYQVTEQVQFENTNKKYVLPTETDRLTLYTCEAQVLGTSSNRIGVLCDLVSKQFYNPLQDGESS
ncbi:MAG: class D sortase [Oscillospiraceae bacterium]|nr:class D sortase [Oscillospiraceae bacterium]